MNAQAQTVFDTLQRPRGVICGVCATLGERSGVPVLLIRIAATILLLAHGLVSIVLYMICAAWMKRPAGANWGNFGAAAASFRPAPPPAGPSSASFSWDQRGVVDRFRRLDERLARMEAEACNNEAGLRRAFHDLERRA